MATPLALLLGGLFFAVICGFGGMFNSRRIDSKSAKISDDVFLTSTRIWSALAPAQQKELSELNLLLSQELWIEENVPIASLKGVSPEKILVELANHGEIRFGKGVSKRHATPFDMLEAEKAMQSPEEAVVPATADTKPVTGESGKSRKKIYRVRAKNTRTLTSTEEKVESEPLSAPVAEPELSIQQERDIENDSPDNEDGTETK